jgi:hypothetical protein
MLTFGVVALRVIDRRRAEEFWCAALGYEIRQDGFGGWATVLIPPDGTGTMIAAGQRDAARGSTLSGQVGGPGRCVSKQRIYQGRVDLVSIRGNDLDHGAASGVTVHGYLLAKAAIESCLTAVQS